MIEKVGEIKFDEKILDVYSSMDEPLFIAYEVAEMFGYNDVLEIEGLCEKMSISSNLRCLMARKLQSFS